MKIYKSVVDVDFKSDDLRKTFLESLISVPELYGATPCYSDNGGGLRVEVASKLEHAPSKAIDFLARACEGIEGITVHTRREQ
jgi:hypothetical protein